MSRTTLIKGEDATSPDGMLSLLRQWSSAHKGAVTVIAIAVAVFAVLAPFTAGSLSLVEANKRLTYQGAAAAGYILSAIPNPVQVCSGGGANITISWSGNSNFAQIAITRGSVSGSQIYRGYGESGSVKVDNASQGETFYLLGNVPTRSNVFLLRSKPVVLAQTSISHTTQGCNTFPNPIVPSVSVNPCEGPGIKVFAVTASSALPANPPALAADNNLSTFWNSGGYPTKWINLDLGSIHTVSGLCVATEQTPGGATRHEVVGSSTPYGRTTLLASINEALPNRQWKFIPLPITNLRSIQITTLASPSWVAWREIKVLLKPAESISQGIIGYYGDLYTGSDTYNGAASDSQDLGSGSRIIGQGQSGETNGLLPAQSKSQQYAQTSYYSESGYVYRPGDTIWERNSAVCVNNCRPAYDSCNQRRPTFPPEVCLGEYNTCFSQCMSSLEGPEPGRIPPPVSFPPPTR